MTLMKNAGQTFTTSPNQNTLDEFRSSWLEAYKIWQRVEMFNIGKAEELQYLARTTLKISRVEYEEKISYYKSLVDKLKKEKGIE